MWLDPEKLKKFIRESDLLSESEVTKLYDEASKSGRTLEEVFLSSGQIKEDDFHRIKAYLLGIPFVSLKQEKIERETLFMIPEPIARKHNIVAFRKRGAELEVAMLDPEDLQAIEFIKKGSGLKILPRLTDTESVKHLILQYQKSLKAEFGDIIQEESKRLAATGPADDLPAGPTKDLADGSP